MDDASKSASPIRCVYVVHGKEAFLRRVHLQRVVGHVLGDDPDPMARSEFDGADAELAAVLDDLRTLPLLSDRKLVVVLDADAFVRRYRAGLEDYVASPSASGVLVLICDSWPKNTKLAKAVAKVGHAASCEVPPVGKLPGWLVAYAKKRQGKALGMAVARKLVEFGGGELSNLCNDVDKLAVYVGDAAMITEEDVEALIGQHRQEKVFGIVDAASSGDLAGAMTLWEQVLATDRDAPYRALGGLAWALRRLIDQRGARDRARLERHLASLADADQAVKTGAGTVQSVVERLIVGLAKG